MLFESFLSIRYLKAKRKQTFISVITVISIAGIAVGVMALIVVLSVMNGFRADLMSKILGMNSHLFVLSHGGPFTNYRETLDKVRAVDGVTASTPFIYSQVMVNHMGTASGAVLWGIDPQSAGEVIDIKKIIKSGAFISLEEKQGEHPAIIIGKELANRIGAGKGNVLTVISPQGKLTPIGRAPNNRQYLVTALFDSGYYEYDANMAFISLAEAQDLLGLENQVIGLQVNLKNLNATEKAGALIEKNLGFPFYTRDWKEMNRSLVEALLWEQIAMWVILAMIVLVAGLNIINTLVMVVLEKHREIAILRTMGAAKKSIMAIFVLQGLIVGLVGTFLGLLSGLGICASIARFKFIHLPADVYYIATLPVKVDWFEVLLITAASLTISLLATLYPAWRAAQLNPVEALRYE
ncbi:MAG: lipoprotein-releasing ABC transporter permease subunit [Desulfobacteraceae bacterium]|nr:MAG: lipoprotein-releasing ABC transporter permease subunit [Desulfobacteraceae bacterium]